MNRRRAVSVARDVVGVVREHNITFKAGSIAHAAFLSLLPLLLLVLLVTGAVGNEYLTERITEMARAHLSPAGRGLVYEALTNASDRAGASLIGIVTLVWGMLRVFRGINTAFDELYDEDREESILGTVADSVVVFTVVVLATVGVSLAAATLARVDHLIVAVLNPLALLVGLFVAFYPMYYVFPEADVGRREAAPGAVVAAVGWVLLEIVFGLYADAVNTVGTYETMGAVILLLVWLYGNAFVLLCGAAVNIVLAGRHDEDAGDHDQDEDEDDSDQYDDEDEGADADEAERDADDAPHETHGSGDVPV